MHYPESLRVPEKKRLFKKEDIFVSGNVWERKKETKVKETETSRNRPKFWERKSCFHYLCLQAAPEHPHEKLNNLISGRSLIL